MPYVNENGVITIDEIAAQNDINRAAAAQRILRDAETKLQLLIAQSSEFSGETAQALNEQATELLRRVTALNQKLADMQTYTRNTVTRYKLLDEQIKAALEASMAEIK